MAAAATKRTCPIEVGQSRKVSLNPAPLFPRRTHSLPLHKAMWVCFTGIVSFPAAKGKGNKGEGRKGQRRTVELVNHSVYHKYKEEKILSGTVNKCVKLQSC